MDADVRFLKHTEKSVLKNLSRWVFQSRRTPLGDLNNGGVKDATGIG